MPWEKTFDENQALDAAMQVFWHKGYEAASMADLLAATGLTRGSLYNAFGSKPALFERTLLRYDQEHRSRLLAQLQALDDPLLAISQFFTLVVEETRGDPQRKGCFLINTALDCGRHNAPVNQMVTQALAQLHAFFKERIEIAHARGLVPSTLSPETGATALLALLTSIRVLGRGAVADQTLLTIRDQAMALIGQKAA